MVDKTMFPPTPDNPDRAAVVGAGNDLVVTFTQGGNALFLRQDGTWALPPGGGGGSVWGGITGTLSNQTDLQNALNLKANTSSLATVATSGAYSDLSGKPTLGTVAALSYPGGTSSFLRADGTWAIPVDVNAQWGNISGTLSAQTDLQSALNAKAPLASPTLTGTPVAPTAAVSTNTTQIATTAFVLGQAGSATPLVNGTATSGSSLLYTRQDHVHPTDTSRMSNSVMTTAADIIVGGVSGAPGRLAVGSVGQVLTIAAGPTIAWATPGTGMTNPMTTSQDLIVGGASGAPGRLGVGGNNQVLTVVSGAVAWANAASGFTNPMTTAGDMIVGDVGGAAIRMGAGSNGQVLTMVSGAPAWAAAAGGGNVSGPGSATTGNLAVWNNVGGTLLADSTLIAANINTMTTAAGAAGRVLTSGGTNKTVQDSGTLLSALAPLASPALTGTPTSTTAAVNTNTTQIATTAFVVGQASSSAPLMNGTAAQGTSLLYARQDHVHASDTSRAPLASPTFTGTPAAPTAAVGTNTTQLATTAYVQQEKSYSSINSQSAAYTLVAADAGKTILHPSADTTARTFTIPANSSVPYQVGTIINFVNQNGAGAVTIAITTDTMRLAGAGTTGSRTLAANGIASAEKITSTEWIINGTGLT